MAVNQIKAGAALNYVVLGLSNLVGLLYTPYMLRMMGQSEYGLYSLVGSVIAYLTILDFGFGNAIIRYTAKFRAEGRTQEQYSMFGMFFVLYSLIGLIALAAGAGLYFNVEAIFGDTMSAEEIGKARILLILMLFNLAFSFPMGIFGSIITAYEDFIFQKAVQIARIVLNTAVMICLLHWGYRAIAMVVVQTVFNVATLLLNWFYCRYKINIKLVFGKFRWGFLKEIAIYSFWIFLNAIMDRIYWSTGQFVLGAVVGTAAVAVFAVAINLESMYLGFSTAISGVFLPKVTAMVATHKSDEEISNLFIRTGRIQYIVMAFILSGFILFGRQFINIWAGDGYEDAYIIALCFFIPLTVPLIQNMGITILQARNQMKFRSIIYVIIAGLSLAAQIPMAKYFGGIGCAAAIAAALTLGQILIMNVYYYRRQNIDIPKFWYEIGKMSIVPIISVIVFGRILKSYPTDTLLSLCVGITVYSAIYIPLFWIFGMNDDEKRLIGTPIKRLALKLCGK